MSTAQRQPVTNAGIFDILPLMTEQPSARERQLQLTISFTHQRAMETHVNRKTEKQTPAS
jgi:hypothetical protein